MLMRLLVAFVWPSLTMDISMASLAMCVLGWPEARIGAAVNVVILFVVAVGRQAG